MSNTAWKLISLRITRGQAKELDKHVKAGRYPSRSEAIRTAINDLLEDEYIMVKE